MSVIIDEPRDAAAQQAVIEAFLDALWMERGLSDNTLVAYRTDLQGLARALATRGTTLLEATREDLLSYLARRVNSGARPRSTARLVSSLRRFYQYQVRVGRLQVDPSARIETPKIGSPRR